MASKTKVKGKKVKKEKKAARDYSAPPNRERTPVFLENPNDNSRRADAWRQSHRHQKSPALSHRQRKSPALPMIFDDDVIVATRQRGDYPKYKNFHTDYSDSSSNPTVCQFCHTSAPRLTGDRCCRKCGKSLLVCLRSICKAPRLPWDKFCCDCGVEFLPGDVKDDPRRNRSTPFLISHDRVDCTFCSAMVADPFEDHRCRNCGKLRLRCPNEMCKVVGRFPQDLYCHRCGVNLSDPGGHLGTTSGHKGQQSSSCALM